MDQIVPQVSSLKTPKMFYSLIRLFEDKDINQKIGFEKTVEECEDPECRTSWSGIRRSGEWRSGDSHLEWSHRIIEFIHSRNVCQKEVINFNKLWEEEEEEAQLIRKEEERWE